MTPLRVLSFLAFAFFGGVVAREDMADGKIRNGRLAWGFGACLLAYGLGLALSLGGRFGLVEDYLFLRFYPAAAIHAAISFAAALTLWFWDIWPAGDAKFFVVCAVFAPLIDPGLQTFPRYLALHLLINSFILAAAYVFWDMALSLARSAAALGAREMAAWPRALPARLAGGLREAATKWKEIVPLALNMACLFLAQGIARQFMTRYAARWISSPFVLLVLFFLLWEKLGRLAASKRLAGVSVVVIGACAVAGMFQRSAWELLGLSLARFAGFGVLFIAARLALERCLNARAAFTVERDNIEPGLVLSEKTLTFLRSDPDYFREHFTPLFRDGLSRLQAQALKQWLLGLPKERSSIEALRGNPFAIWIFAGTMLALILRRDAASLALSLFR